MMVKPQLKLVPETRDVCAIVRLETREGAGEACEALLRDFAFLVEADEPGCRSYVVTRTLGSRTHFAAHARFADMRAFEAHADTDHMKRVMPRLNALLTAPISMEIFFAI